VLLDDATRLPWLADIWPLPPLRSIISIGDVVLAAGLIPLLHALMSWTPPDAPGSPAPATTEDPVQHPDAGRDAQGS
jgi:hypothetical protein